MTISAGRLPIQPGERAPEFSVIGANRDGRVSSADFRSRSPFFLALFRGLY
jgi:hypothetical protein